MVMPGVLNVTLGFYKLWIKGRYPLRFFILEGALIRVLYTFYICNLTLFINVVGLVSFILVLAIYVLCTVHFPSKAAVPVHNYNLFFLVYLGQSFSNEVNSNWGYCGDSSKLYPLDHGFIVFTVIGLLVVIMLSFVIKKLFSWRLVSLWNICFV